ncbi:MAG: GTPase HflX [Tissierellia bacterium]|nr:GTPase HflX [Tissierellia bacterium]
MTLEARNKEKVLIVGVELESDTIDIEDSMDELEKLVEAAGGVVLGRIIQKRRGIDPAYFIGRGKAMEIKNYCEELDVDTVVFNDELSGAQLRNLEKLIDKKIVDRTNLILDIFANRASSKEGKLQVKLAQLKYRLPRLVGLRDYLSREGGGIGTRGPGEQKLETDRRHILREINNIERALKEAEKTREIKRKRRENSNLPIVALVGYTNAGKSTLLNRIMEMDEEYDESKKVFEYDMLFATLDTSLRRGRLPNGQVFLMTDTVGFVDKLPTHLIEAFKGTLEEIKYADLILHVVDASNSNLDIQVKTTMDILKELEVIDKPIITVFNKMDKVDINNLIYDNKYIGKKVFISCKDGTNLDKLLQMIQESLAVSYKDVTLLIPYGDQQLVSYFLENYNVASVEYDERGTKLRFNISQMDYERYFKYIIEE